MPNHKSAVKRVKQAAAARERNRANRSTFRTTLKAADTALAAGDPAKAKDALQAALKIIGKTEKKGLIHPNKAARHASRLTKRLNAMEGTKS
jgi:small subunit ribosomal protein S20